MDILKQVEGLLGVATDILEGDSGQYSTAVDLRQYAPAVDNLIEVITENATKHQVKMTSLLDAAHNGTALVKS